MQASLPDLKDVWQWLSTVPDPEIPAISLVDLGIIRELRYEDGTLIVVITPTYSGCPATAVINQEIEAKLRANGIEALRLDRQLSPPWTTDWMSESGREKLRGYGIAPPIGKSTTTKSIWIQPEGTPAVPCPQCGSKNTSLVSQFGSTPCKSNYRCLDCLEPFDYFKCI